MPKKDDDAKKPASEAALDQRWKLQVFYLCFYGFMTQIRPGESFITPYLLGADKNFTRTEVSHGQPVLHWLSPFQPQSPPWGWPEHPLAALGHGGVAWWVVRGGAFWVGGEGRGRRQPVSIWQHVPDPLGYKVTLYPQSQAPCAQAGNHFWGVMLDPGLPGQPVGWQGGAGLGEAPSHFTGETLPCWHGAQWGAQGWVPLGCWQRGG